MLAFQHIVKLDLYLIFLDYLIFFVMVCFIDYVQMFYVPYMIKLAETNLECLF